MPAMERESSLGLDETDTSGAGYEPDYEEDNNNNNNNNNNVTATATTTTTTTTTPYDDEGFNLPPGRMHATRSTSDLRLKGIQQQQHVSLPNLSSLMNSNYNSNNNKAMNLGGGGGALSNDTSSTSSNSSSGGGPSSHGGLLLVRSHSAPKDRRLNALRGTPGGGSDPNFSLFSPPSPRGGNNSRGTIGSSLMAAMGDGNSSLSSLEDFVDADILYDRAGATMNDSSNNNDSHSLGGGGSKTPRRNSTSNLPPVNERLSEDTLEDVHAFSDVKVAYSSASSIASRVSVTTAENDKLILDPLVEGDDEDDEQEDSLMNPQNHHDENDLFNDDDYYHSHGAVDAENRPAAVILTNMEKLKISNTAAGGGHNNSSAGGGPSLSAASVGGGEDSLAVGASTLADISEFGPSSQT